MPEAEALSAMREKAIHEGNVLVIRNEGPKGGPGMPETLAVTMNLSMSGYMQRYVKSVVSAAKGAYLD